ncbi:MAG: spinster family MFS transporter [Gemmatimonadales bacterium]
MAEPRRETRLFVLLCALNLLNYIDRQAVTGLLEPIRKDLGATDAQMGLVGSAFLLTYTLLPPIFGWLGDRMKRTRLLATSAAAWCLATAASGLVRSVGQLALARGTVGLGEASYMANTPGIISDLYPASRRGRMLSIFYSAAPIGAALGVAIAGFIAGSMGWRAACFIVGLPGLVLVAALYRAADPVRGAMDAAPAVAGPGTISQILRALAGNPVFVLLTLGIAGQVFLQNAVEYWLPTILQRDKAIPIAEANATYGAMVFIAGVVGPLLGALVGDWLRRKTPRGYFLVAAGAVLGAVVPLAILAVAGSRVPIFACVLVEALLGNAAVGLVMAMAMEQVGAEIRSSAAAVLLTSMHLLGDFISWPLVGAMSTAMERGGLGWLRALAVSFGASDAHHLSIALVSVAVPAGCLAAIFFLASARLTRAPVLST